jgi:hypothetical protein
MSAPRRLSTSVYTAEGGRYRAGVSLSLGLLVVLYAAARVAQAFPNKVPMVALAAAHVLLPLLFALIHGAQVYRLRGVLIFTALCLVVGNVLEN